MSDITHSLLGAGQIKKRTFDEENSALRVILSGATEMEMAISAEDGDSVLTVSSQSQQSATIDNASSGVVIPEFSVAGLTKIALYTKTTETVDGEQACVLEVSPTDSGDFWCQASTVTEDTQVGVTKCSGAINISARRARVKMDAITSGSFELAVVASQ